MNKETYESNRLALEAARFKLLNICKAYTTAKPVLLLAKKILFFKPKRAAVIGLLIATLDEICDV